MKIKLYLKLYLFIMSNKIQSTDSHWILYLTPLFMITSVYAAKCKFLILALLEWTVIMSSICYWSNLNCNIRRSIDIILVQVCFLVHIYYAIKYKAQKTLFFFSFTVIFYFLGQYYKSDVLHSFSWISTLIGTILLINHLCKVNKDIKN
jgi:hypothetical protein